MRARAWGVAIAASAVICAPACIVGGVFACGDDDDCRKGHAQATCEASGWCSFPDPACISGKRYSEWAGDGLGRECTEPGTGDASDGESSGATETGPMQGPERGSEHCDGDCFTPGAPMWTQIFESEDDDFGHDIATAPTGEIYVAGQIAQEDGEGWVARVPAGPLVKFGGARPDAALALVVVSGADLPMPGDERPVVFVAGYRSRTLDSIDEGENRFVQRDDDKGDVAFYDLWTYDEPYSTGSGTSVKHFDDRFADIVTAPDLERVVVLGHTRALADGSTANAAVCTFFTAVQESEGAQLDTCDVGGIADGADDRVHAGARAMDGRLYAVGSLQSGGNLEANLAPWISEVDPALASPFVAPFVVEGDGDAVFEDVAIDGDGRPVAVGWRGGEGWITRWNGALTAFEDPQPSMPKGAALYGVAIDGSGAIVVVGSVPSVDHGTDAWVQKLDASFVELWSATADGDAGADDVARGVAVDATDAVIVVGDLVQIGTDRDVWVRAYAP